MTLSFLSPDVRRLALALGGEGAQSALHFALNLILMTLLPPSEYGAFAFTLVLGGVGLVYMRSLTAMPAATYLGRARLARAADFYEGVFGAAALLLSAVIAAVAAAVLGRVSSDAAFGGAAVVGLWALRSHLRTVGFARRESLAVTAGDVVFAVVGASASALACSFDPNRLEGVLAALALANIAGGAVLLMARRAPARADFSRRALWFYLRLARRLLWSLYSVTATVLLSQGVAFLVVAFAGPAAFAPIAAMLAFFAPMRIFAMSLSNMLQPEIARLVARGDEAGWRTMRAAWTLRACVLGLVYGNLGFLVIPRLHLHAFSHEPIMFVAVSAWSLYAVVLGYLLPRLLLEARMRFRQIAAITTAGAAASLGLTAAALLVAPPSCAILGAVIGEIVAAAATWKIAAQPLVERGRAGPRWTGRLDPARDLKAGARL